MKTHALAQQLLKMPDVECFVSVDVSTGEDDAEARVFGDVYGLQCNGRPEDNPDVTILCIEER